MNPLSALAARGTPAIAPTGPTADPDRAARQTAEAFEAMFVAQLLGQMFKGVSAAAPFGGGAGEQVYRDMLGEQYAKTIARSGGIGIADDIHRQILAMQEAQRP